MSDTLQVHLDKKLVEWLRAEAFLTRDSLSTIVQRLVDCFGFGSLSMTSEGPQINLVGSQHTEEAMEARQELDYLAWCLSDETTRIRYQRTLEAHGKKPWSPTAEHRAAISKRHKGLQRTPEQRAAARIKRLEYLARTR